MPNKHFYFSACLFLLISLASVAAAQDYEYAESEVDEKERRRQEWQSLPTIDRIRFGGDIGFSAGQNVSSFSGSALVLYMPTERLYVGPSVRYLNINYRIFDQSYSLLGVSAIGRYDLAQISGFDIFSQVEIESLRGSINDRNTNVRTPEQWFNSAFIGLGVSSRLSKRASINLYLAYNPAWDGINTVYAEPWIFRTYLLF